MSTKSRTYTKAEIAQIDRDLEDRVRKELGMPAEPELDAVAKAAKQVKKSQQRLDEAIISAYETGNFGARKIADKARVSHMTVMRLVRKSTGVPQR